MESKSQLLHQKLFVMTPVAFTFQALAILAIGGIFGTCYIYANFSKRLGRKRCIRNSANNDGDYKMNGNYVCLIHGGAGVISKAIDSQSYYDGLKTVVTSIYHFIEDSHTSEKNLSAVDIVEFGVKLLEDNQLFNAGYGSVYTSNETHELEASIMDGSNLNSGAVSLVKTTKNPISLARVVMEETKHAYMAGESAEQLASLRGLETVEESYYNTKVRLDQLHKAMNAQVVINDCDDEDTRLGDEAGSKGTVGCVCMYNGHVAAATSTGGMTNKLPGRIGDSPIIGAGTYANDETVAVSATGKGEVFMRHVVAYDISSRMLYGGQDVYEAVKATVNSLPPQSGGVIAVDRNGDYCMEFNSNGMFRGVCYASGHCEIGIWDELIRFNIME